MRFLRLPFFLLGLLGSCASPAAPLSAASEAAEPAQVEDHSWSSASDADPAQVHARLESASPDWQASLVIDNGETGIWTVKPYSFFPQYATQELFGLDDLGRCWVLVSYSGKWTPFPVLRDGVWLGALAQGEADPRVAGPEVYTGGKIGRLYQLRAYHDGGLDARRIASFPGKELHTVVAGEFDPRNDTTEVLVFTRPGAWYRATPTGEHGEWETQDLGPLPARIRDALVLPPDASGRSALLTAARDGAIRELRFDANGPQWTMIHQVGQGRGRLSLAPGSAGRVFYSTADDGRVFRHERAAQGWQTELVHAGSHGPRGLAAGRFHPDPERECLALFGYSGRVELLSRRPGEAWQSELLFVDRDKGHWLCAGEFDGRNDTLEIFASGYGGRIVMLSREPAR